MCAVRAPPFLREKIEEFPEKKMLLHYNRPIALEIKLYQ